MVTNRYCRVDRPFPTPFKLGRKSMVKGSEFEHYKLCIAADAAGIPAPAYVPPVTEVFKPLDTCAMEMGVNRRTLDRLIYATRKAALSAVAAE